MSEEITIKEHFELCPFCKDEAKGGFDHDWGQYFIECPSCECRIMGDNISIVIKYWNTRPIEDDLRRQISVLDDRVKNFRRRYSELFDKINVILCEQSCHAQELAKRDEEIKQYKSQIEAEAECSWSYRAEIDRLTDEIKRLRERALPELPEHIRVVQITFLLTGLCEALVQDRNTFKLAKGLQCENLREAVEAAIAKIKEGGE